MLCRGGFRAVSDKNALWRKNDFFQAATGLVVIDRGSPLVESVKTKILRLLEDDASGQEALLRGFVLWQSRLLACEDGAIRYEADNDDGFLGVSQATLILKK